MPRIMLCGWLWTIEELVQLWPTPSDPFGFPSSFVYYLKGSGPHVMMVMWLNDGDVVDCIYLFADEELLKWGFPEDVW